MTLSPRLHLPFVCSLAAALSTLALGARAQTGYLYGSSFGDSNSSGGIFKVNVQTDSVESWHEVNDQNGNPGVADGIAVDGGGRVLYSALGATGEFRAYNPSTGDDSLLFSTLGTPLDVVVEPGGATALVSVQSLTNPSSSAIYRVNMGPTPSATAFIPVPADGLAYVGPALFANITTVQSSNNVSQIAQYDPVSGALVRSAAPANGPGRLDGLTFDAYTGLLFAASQAGQGIYAIDPVTLAFTFIALDDKAKALDSRVQGIGALDGITSDGAGNLYIAGGQNDRIYRYRLTDKADPTQGDLTQLAADVGNVDDVVWVAGASGVGVVPEGSSLALLLAGAIPMAAGAVLSRRRRRTTGATD